MTPTEAGEDVKEKKEVMARSHQGAHFFLNLPSGESGDCSSVQVATIVGSINMHSSDD